MASLHGVGLKVAGPLEMNAEHWEEKKLSQSPSSLKAVGGPEAVNWTAHCVEQLQAF
jgi:hypothetical protein